MVLLRSLLWHFEKHHEASCRCKVANLLPKVKSAQMPILARRMSRADHAGTINLWVPDNFLTLHGMNKYEDCVSCMGHAALHHVMPSTYEYASNKQHCVNMRRG